MLVPREGHMSSDNGRGYGNNAGSTQTRATDLGPSYVPESEGSGLALRGYLDVLRRRKWVIIALVVVATGAAFFYSWRQPKQYAASASLIYEKQVDLSNPLTGQSYTDPNERAVQLSSVSGILTSPDMKARADAQLETNGEAVSGFTVTAAPIIDESDVNGAYTSSMVRVTATSQDPKLAAAAANAYALTFVEYRKETVRQQIQNAIDAVNAKMDTYQGNAKKSTDYLVLQQRQQDLQLLRSTATGNFRMLVPATVPDTPFAPKPVRNALLGLVAGFIIAIGLAFLLEQFDTRLRKTDEVAGLLRMPILGRIPRISHKLLTEGAVVALKHPDGNVAEAFRLVRTNLEFMAVDQELTSALVTSCVQGEGKSVAVANMAVTMAIAGKKVVVVDADLRRPRQHTYFGLRNEHGVSTVVSGQDKLADALQPVGVAYLERAPSVSGFSDWAGGAGARSRLYVLSSGPIPPNPGEMVASQRFASIIERLQDEADLVLVDTPAMLPVGDTSAIAARVGGLVFLVDMRVVKRPQLQAAAEQLMRLPTNLLGTIIRVEGVGGHYGYASYKYNSYTYSENGKGSGRHRQKAPEKAQI
jgi:Mrp family chromosome partitioning ATPase/capsular polysaccharide biosynthesis protein